MSRNSWRTTIKAEWTSSLTGHVSIIVHQQIFGMAKGAKQDAWRRLFGQSWSLSFSTQYSRRWLQNYCWYLENIRRTRPWRVCVQSGNTKEKSSEAELKNESFASTSNVFVMRAILIQTQMVHLRRSAELVLNGLLAPYPRPKRGSSVSSRRNIMDLMNKDNSSSETTIDKSALGTLNHLSRSPLM